MDSTGLEFCCQAIVIGDFGHDSEILAAEKDLKANQAVYKKRPEYEYEPYAEDYNTRENLLRDIEAELGNPLTLATTLAKDQAIAGKLLKKAGFKILKRFTNGGSRELILWGKVDPGHEVKPAKKTAKKVKKIKK